MFVTVLICTWNRSRLLEQTLQQMTSLRAPSNGDWELLVVNNNCTDETESVLERFMGRLPLRHLLEPKQGKAYALNLGLREARGELIVFTDDDVLVDPNWLVELCSAADRWPEASFFAGRVDPWFEIPPSPALAKALDAVADGFCGIDLGSNERYLTVDESPKGANMACRRKSIESLFFDPQFCPSGNIKLFGEETVFCNQIRSNGGRGLWVPGAILKHYVPAERLGFRYLKSFYYGLGQCYVRLGKLADGPRIAGVPRWLLRNYCEALGRRALSLISPSKVYRIRTMTDLWRLQGMINESRTQFRFQADQGASEAEASVRGVKQPVHGDIQ